MRLWKKSFVSVAFASSLLLSGCVNGESPEQEIFETLEKVVGLEESFETQQEPLLELEQKEKEVYNEIINLGMKEFDQIVKLSEEGLSLVEQREAAMHTEKESIETAREQFEEVKNSIELLEDEELKKEAQSLYQLMEKRYESYMTLFNDYMAATELDKELYVLFQTEDLTLEQLQLQINKINETYEKIQESNQLFNDFTEQYNEAKFTFYKNAGLDVEYKN
ncbi:YkyA family protein [Sutcliffiella halmapala]|uniref:YkyA family protein n=1 Tax=Sutcliffiella halmapala TaxID=79882 RepID=UPI000995D00E|nr:YkyA family protein [Sutcliffiella halmapala]